MTLPHQVMHRGLTNVLYKYLRMAATSKWTIFDLNVVTFGL